MVSQCKFLESGKKIAFNVRHGVVIVDSSGKVTSRGHIKVVMSRVKNRIIIKEKAIGNTVRDPSGFAFQPLER